MTEKKHIISAYPITDRAFIMDNVYMPKLKGAVLVFDCPIIAPEAESMELSFLELPMYFDKKEVAQDLTWGVTDPKKIESLVAPLDRVPGADAMHRPDPTPMTVPIVKCGTEESNGKCGASGTVLQVEIDMKQPLGAICSCQRFRNPAREMKIMLHFKEAVRSATCEEILPAGSVISVCDETRELYYEQFAHGVYEQENGQFSYYEWKEPENQESGKTYPLVIWFGGANINYNGYNRGIQVYAKDLEVILTEEEEKYILAPQTDNTIDWKGDCIIEKMVRNFVKTHPVDPARIYCCGQSNGGNNTWRLAAKCADLLACIMPGSGGFYGPGDEAVFEPETNKKRLKPIAENEVAVYAHHGIHDEVAPFEETEQSIEALRELYREKGKTEEEIAQRVNLIVHTDEEGPGMGGHGINPVMMTKENIHEMMKNQRPTDINRLQPAGCDLQ